MIHDASKCEYGSQGCEGTGGKASHMCERCSAKVAGSVVDINRAREKKLPVLETNLEEAMIDCGVFIANMVQMGFHDFSGSFEYEGQVYHLELIKCLHEGPTDPKKGA
jgi:hypothetical protein